MDRRLFQPRWLLAHAIVALVAVLFVSLGLWQLNRLAERRAQNEIGLSRIEAPPAPLEGLGVGSSDLDSLEYRRVTATGVYDASHEVLIRSQVHRGTAGYHVITPLVGERGQAVLVNRGWVPLTMDEAPVAEAPPPAGEVTVEGWVALSQTRPAFGPEDPSDGRLTVVSRVDIDRIQAQTPFPLQRVYLVRADEEGAELPIPVSPPGFDEEGPHLGYAIQWFGFAVVEVVGYYFLARRRLGSSA